MSKKKQYKTSDWCEKTLMHIARECKDAQTNGDVSPYEKTILKKVQKQMTDTLAIISDARKTRNVILQEQSWFENNDSQ